MLDNQLYPQFRAAIHSVTEEGKDVHFQLAERCNLSRVMASDETVWQWGIGCVSLLLVARLLSVEDHPFF